MASTITVDNIQGSTSAGTVKMPAGTIIQSDFVYVTDTITINTSNNYADIPGSSIAITPKFSNSKIVIETFHHTYLGNNVSASTWCSCNLRILRDSTVITAPDLHTNDYFAASYGGDNYRQMAYGMLSRDDTPNTTSAITYKAQANFRHGWDSNASVILNRYGRGMIKVTEISQ